MSANSQEFLDYLKATYPNQVIDTAVVNGELVVITEPQHVVELMTHLRDNENCLFAQLVDVCGVDYPNRERRFDVVYHLLSFRHNMRLRVKVQAGEQTEVPTVQHVFSSAKWFEREAWDMYGILFKDHGDLRRILTDYGFDGHAQRKDFPLTGYVEMRYDEEQKRVIYEPVKLNQAYRVFDFESPWEGAKYPLPGDEKATKA